MLTDVKLRSYLHKDRNYCLAIFDSNCPMYFAANERPDYAQFLDSKPMGYEVCLHKGSVVGAFGIIGSETDYRSINWILISPDSQGLGIGSILMARAIELANKVKIKHIKIAASHLSAPFFARYGAVEILETKDGWGPDMHRIDMELHV